MYECLPALAALGWIGWVGLDDARLEQAPPPRRTWTFSLRGMSEATVRSLHAPEAVVHHAGTGETIVISARPRLLTTHYHGPEPDGHEKAASAWGFTWVLEREAGRLAIRALGETRAADHRYLLDELDVRVPENFPLHLEKPATPPAAAR